MLRRRRKSRRVSQFYNGYLLSSSVAGVELRSNSRDLGLQVLVRRINLGLVLDQEGAENAVVDNGSTLFYWQIRMSIILVKWRAATYFSAIEMGNGDLR